MSVRDMLMAAAGVDTGGGTDDNFENVTLLLNGDGTNGAQNNTFVDSSSNNFSITRNGNTTQGSFSPYGSLWSNYFNGSTDYLSVADNAALQFGTGDFTIECWIYVSSFSATVNAVISKRYTSAVDTTWAIDFEANNGNLRYRILNSTGGVITVPIGTVSLNTWTHIAVSKQSGTTRTYLNGIAGSTTTNSTAIDGSTYNLKIGGGGTGAGEYINGYISNARIVKGTAVYTSAFTPSTTPLTAVSGTSLLTCQSNRFIDNSSNAFAVTVTGTPSVQRFSPFNPTASYDTATIGSSGYFDGSGDYLTVPDNAALQPSNGNFTLESWVYLNDDVPSAYFIYGDVENQTGNGGYTLYVVSSSGNKPEFFWTTNGSYGTGIRLTSSINISKKCWNHIAVTRNGTTFTLWVNGVSSATTTSSSSIYDSSSAKYIGIASDLYGEFNGYISNLRLVIGTAVYTTTFTPPTAPLTSITNTQLLCNFTNAGIPDSAMMNDLLTVGQAQISTSVVKYGTGSIYLDGSDDQLVGSANSIYNFGSGNFTAEFWINTTDTASGRVVLSNADSGGASSTNWGFYTNLVTTNKLSFYASNGSTYFVQLHSTSDVTTGSWIHVAAVRNGSNFNLYINGVSEASTTSSTAISSTVRSIRVGSNGGANVNLNGYIDDLRITKGYARYTANFTPPTSAFYTY